MGFSYLENKKWDEVSRSERFFCSEFFHLIRGKENEFIRWLKDKRWFNETKRLNFTNEELEMEWEAGFEVCFYRDFYSLFKRTPIGSSGFSSKRTFDLCLLSEKRIIIIEAKAQQKFIYDDTRKFVEDKDSIRRLLNNNDLKVELLALASETYFNNHKIHGFQGTLDVFDGVITWKELYEHYNNNIFDYAEKSYNS